MSIDCPGSVSTGALGDALCTNGSGTPVAWVYTPPFDVSALDPTTLATCFGIGFTLIGVSWFIGKAVGIVLKFIRGV